MGKRVEQESNLEPIIAKVSQWPISKFAELAKEMTLDTDPIAKGICVAKKASQMLINSILMGIPLPSVILHNTSGEGEIDRYQIIDGKQRITSILRFMGALPVARSFMQERMIKLKTVEGFENLAKVSPDVLGDVVLTGSDTSGMLGEEVLPRYKKWHKNKKYGITGEEFKQMKSKHLPFSLRKKEFDGVESLSHLNNKFYHEIRDEIIEICGRTSEVKKVFESNQDFYTIPVIIYDAKTTQRQIRRVFARYNTQGTKLNATEVNNAAFQDLFAMKAVLALSR